MSDVFGGGGVQAPAGNSATPNFQGLPDAEFERRVEDLMGRYEECDLCAHDCDVDRTAGEIGTCQVDDTVYVSAHFPHFGEEDVLKGSVTVTESSMYKYLLVVSSNI